MVDLCRRALLCGAAAGGLLGLAGCQIRLDARTDPIRLNAAPTTAPLLGDMEAPTAVWAYNGAAPGPVLRVPRGGTLAVRLENALTQDTSIHWHGIRIDNAMDGVVGLTQAAVAPGDGFDYRFVCPDAGTYWYHSHYRSWEQVARGLHGLLIVEEAEPPAVDREILLVLDDWRLDEAGAIHESFGALHDWAHAGRIGNWVTINGRPPGDLPLRAGERVRLRVLNAATARIFAIAVEGHAAQVAALDGFAVAPFAPAESVLLGPGQRVDFLLDATGEPGGRYALLDDAYDDPRPIGFFAYSDAPPLRAQFDAPPRLGETRPPPAPDLSQALGADMVMEGGAMGGLAGAMLDGEMKGMRALAQAGRVWAVNGVAGDLDKPLLSVRRGRSVTVRMANETAWPHAMHLHGHHFTVLSVDGKPAEGAGRIWRDTHLMAPRETADIAFVADNPGKWFFHCHMLGHQAGGMRTWMEVT
jgi:FtsP/CotA-like multicopper oxidase with cupredoxin domain